MMASNGKRESVPDTLKHGFLVKKNISHHRWKTRWFALHEDRLNYYSKRDKTKTVGSIPLYRASVNYPVCGYEKRTSVFSISTASGRVALLKASDKNMRATWTHAIGGVIRLLSPSAQTEPEQELDQNVPKDINLSELLGAMQDREAGIPLDGCLIDNVLYHNCFSGALAVDWLMKWGFARQRSSALVLLDQLLQIAHIQPIITNVFDIQNVSRSQHVIDELHIHYRFSSLNRLSQGLFMESSSESSSSSAGEASEGNVLDAEEKKDEIKLGKIIRTDFLGVRGHLRKRWKVRKVILRENPPSIQLYSACKNIEDPLKTINLNVETKALDVEDKEIEELIDAPLPKKRANVFCVTRPNRRPLMFKAEDQGQKVDWMKSFNSAVSVVS